MPSYTLIIFDDRNKNFMKDIGASFAKAVISFSPPSNQTNFSSQMNIGGRQTYRDDVILVEHGSVQM